MDRVTIQVGSYGVNCTILFEGSRAWVVDPGAEGARIAALLKQRGLSLAGILLTHAHFDHVGGVEALQDAWPELPVFVGMEDAVMFGHPFNQCPPDYPLAPKPRNLLDISEGTVPDIDKGTVPRVGTVPGMEVIRTPGHTPGGVSLLFRNFPGAPLLLSGDTLFAGSVGRTDFPGGSMAALMRSLGELSKLPADTVVVPGHGPETTIGKEIRSNPFLA